MYNCTISGETALAPKLVQTGQFTKIRTINVEQDELHFTIETKLQQYTRCFMTHSCLRALVEPTWFQYL